jgi:hypothetical protein
VSDKYDQYGNIVVTIPIADLHEIFDRLDEKDDETQSNVPTDADDFTHDKTYDSSHIETIDQATPMQIIPHTERADVRAASHTAAARATDDMVLNFGDTYDSSHIEIIEHQATPMQIIPHNERAAAAHAAADTELNFGDIHNPSPLDTSTKKTQETPMPNLTHVKRDADAAHTAAADLDTTGAALPTPIVKKTILMKTGLMSNKSPMRTAKERHQSLTNSSKKETQPTSEFGSNPMLNKSEIPPIIDIDNDNITDSSVDNYLNEISSILHKYEEIIKKNKTKETINQIIQNIEKWDANITKIKSHIDFSKKIGLNSTLTTCNNLIIGIKKTINPKPPKGAPKGGNLRKTKKYKKRITRKFNINQKNRTR